jgi:hypothetical protein
VIAVRLAEPRDAAAISALLIDSITQLCAADHRNDPEILARWLANKTPEGVGLWFANPDNTMLVAEREGELAAAGAFNVSREIILNYVAPAHRFMGVSSALLAAIEASLGPGEAMLTSTATARQFYRSRGWIETGDQAGMTAYPMRKMLA